MHRCTVARVPGCDPNCGIAAVNSLGVKIWGKYRETLAKFLPDVNSDLHSPSIEAQTVWVLAYTVPMGSAPWNKKTIGGSNHRWYTRVNAQPVFDKKYGEGKFKELAQLVDDSASYLNDNGGSPYHRKIAEAMTEMNSKEVYEHPVSNFEGYLNNVDKLELNLKKLQRAVKTQWSTRE